ncbi:MAG TPA: hypothetical protein PL000_07175 [Anaerolineales bacterium]|nr:hypothetical protein [Anaerolineales bacterium]
MRYGYGHEAPSEWGYDGYESELGILREDLEKEILGKREECQQCVQSAVDLLFDEQPLKLSALEQVKRDLAYMASFYGIEVPRAV